MLHQVVKSFPDDNPITAITVIEDISKRPQGFVLVSRTHDQDSDADLWRGSSFFAGRVSRYLAISKTEGVPEYIVENIGVIGEKDAPPDGYCLIPKTMDSDAKAWKKRQICYSLARRNVATMAVTDIILLCKSKKAPEGFKLAGEINGLIVCFKVNTQLTPQIPALGYNLNPSGVPLPNLTANKSPTPSNGLYPVISSPVKKTSPGNDEYVNLIMPKRPAPPPPPKSPQSQLQVPRRPPPIVPGSYATLNSHQGLEGVPFVLHPKLEAINRTKDKFQLPAVKIKKKEEIEQEFHYDFRLERQCT